MFSNFNSTAKSSRSQLFYRVAVLKEFKELKRKHLRWRPFLDVFLSILQKFSGQFPYRTPLRDSFCTSWNEVTNWKENTKAFFDQNRWRQMSLRIRPKEIIGVKFFFLLSSDSHENFQQNKKLGPNFASGHFLQKNFVDKNLVTKAPAKRCSVKKALWKSL